MTHEQQQAAQARCDAATKGPWTMESNVRAGGVTHLAVTNRAESHDWMLCSVTRMDLAREVDLANGRFIAHARADLPAALAEIRRLEHTVQTKIPALEAAMVLLQDKNVDLELELEIERARGATP